MPLEFASLASKSVNTLKIYIQEYHISLGHLIAINGSILVEPCVTPATLVPYKASDIASYAYDSIESYAYDSRTNYGHPH